MVLPEQPQCGKQLLPFTFFTDRYPISCFGICYIDET